MEGFKSLPNHAVRVPSYDKLREYANAFAERKLNLLMVLGPPGVGKSSTLRRAMGNSAQWIEGNATPFSIYLEAYGHRDKPIVLDDVDGLYRDRNGVRLLKSLCQSEPIKEVCWYSDSRTLERRRIPPRFATTSPIAILANDWKSSNPDVAALEDRGHIVVFEPTPLEVHREAATWFWDDEIFQFVAANLYLINRHSLRMYGRAWELKSSGLEWRQHILAGLLPETTLLVARLKADPQYVTEKQRVQAFTASGGGCRANYFNHARKLLPQGDTPDIKLAGATSPPGGDLHAQAALGPIGYRSIRLDS